MKRCAVLVLGLALAVLGGPLQAQTAYPAKPVRMLVGFAPGGGNDILARLMAEHFQQTLGQPFVVENRPGASGMIAIEAVRQAAPDGHTLLVGPSSGMAVNPALFAKINYDPVKDFAPISLVGDIPMIVTVNPASKAGTLQEFIASAKRSAKPLLVGSGATSFQLAAAVFASKAGITLDNVNYKGNSQVVTAMLANEVDVALIDAAAVMPQIQAGKLRALAVTGSRRFSQLPDVPTADEAGARGFVMSFWSALFAPAGTPPAVVTKLQGAVQQALAKPEVSRRLKDLGIEPVGSSAAELADTMARDLPLYKDAARLAKV
ncbi:MAG: Bug family tripartite tricarboxylate transporter substrate binding protein, partial [Burkholderiaceae bacterium]